MNNVTASIAKINERIKHAAERSRRDSNEIKLIAVSKRISEKNILQAIQSGQFRFGENYLQEARDKFSSPLLQPIENIRLHFIGHLQTNKAKEAIKNFHVIETVDRLKLALALEKHLTDTNKKLNILVQVNIGREPQKSGVLPENTNELLTRIQECPHLHIRGLMTIPPYNADPESNRPYFSALKKLSQTLLQQNLLGNNGSIELSMGMSNDFEVAIEEGSTMIRVGTAIFGQR